jgi:transposase InsO family protein
VIKANARKYSISALCRCLGIARSTYYYECHGQKDASALEEAVQVAYDENRCVYGQRKLKRVLSRKGWTVSRRRIGRIMAKRGLVSAYTSKKYRAHASKGNESPVPNLLARDFNSQAPGACVVSDLTYVRVGTRWAYICILLELGAREIIGQSAGANKNAELVYQAFSTVKGNLFKIQMFHTDRGSEFDNMLIDELLDSFQISRSLSMKGCPYDNAVAESTFKMIKAEFVYSRRFETLEQLQLELSDYVHWFNNIRLHGTLGYLSPEEFKRSRTL